MIVMAPISIGELFDKITILKIKSMRITALDKRVNISSELRQLQEIAKSAVPPSKEIEDLVATLHAINEALWDIEDGKRAYEREKDFGEHFVQLAREVYLKNDERARVKRRINMLTGSALVEEKSYLNIE